MESAEDGVPKHSKKTYRSSKRFAILVYPEVQQGLFKLAKQYRVSQSVVVETLYNMTDLDRLGELLSLKFEEKINAREYKKDILKRLSGMGNEQLASILAKAHQDNEVVAQ